MSDQPRVYDIVIAQENTFKQVSIDPMIKWPKESNFAIQQIAKNKRLYETAAGNPHSLAASVTNIASIGISLNPASKHAYLVPRNGEVCLDISYIGLMHLAQQSGAILWGQAKTVYESDEYINTGIDSAPVHKSNPFKRNKERGNIIGVYCTVKTKDGSYLTEEMNIDEINKIRNASKASNGPWKTWPEEMMRKSVVKRASKYWPKADRLDLAIDNLNEHEGIEFEHEEKQIDPKIQRMNAAYDRNTDSVVAIKEALAEGNIDYAAECWSEVSDDDRMALSVAPTKGGIFTLEEARLLKSDEFQEARKLYIQENN